VLLRHQLFQPSEVFITEQAGALRRFEPLLVGRRLAGRPSGPCAYRVPSAPGGMRLLRYLALRDPELLAPLLRERPPALLHAHFGVEAVYGMELAQRCGVPMVTTFHGYDATMSTRRLVASGRVTWLVYAIKRGELARRGRLFLCVSEFIRERVLGLGFPEALTRRHYIGVDTTGFAENREDPEQPIVLHVARLVEKKGTTHLLAAFALVAGRHRRARLIVIGDGPRRDSLLLQAKQLGIADRVDWLGAQPHAIVKSWLQRASVFCLPSCTARNGDAEGLAMVLLEAAAAAVPTVSTRHGGMPEAVRDGATGYAVPERNPGRLAEALDGLLSSYALRRELGRQGREFVERNFCLQQQTATLEQHYQSLL
jgi:glycosyltransferase involved in cell wall biosynthesis